jgi:hypothetical protein
MLSNIEVEQLYNSTKDYVDGDCNESNVDVNPRTVWYLDADGDGFSDGNSEVGVCGNIEDDLIAQYTFDTSTTEDSI